MGGKLKAAWDAQLTAGKKQQSLFWACVTVFGKYYLVLCLVVNFVQNVLMIFQALYMGYLVKELVKEPDERPEGYREIVYWYGFVVVALQCLIVLMLHPFFFETFRMGMDVRIACCHLIYNKALKLSHSALAETSVGQIINMLTNDCNRFDWFPQYPHYIVAGPIMTLITTYVLFKTEDFGYDCLAGIAILVLYIPLQYILGKVFTKIREKTANLTDDRVRITQEFVKAMKVIKMYAWEKPFAVVVDQARRKEVNMIRKSSYLRGLNLGLYYVAGKIIVFLILIINVNRTQKLSAEAVFVTIALINQLRIAVCLYIPYAVSMGAEAVVSLNRIEKFLLLDEMVQDDDQQPQGDKAEVTFDKVSAKFKHIQENILTDISFNVKPGQLLAVIGSVGSGKSSVLLSLLKEIPVVSGDVKIQGNIAYASQEAWTFPASLRDNILFGQPYNPKRYREVIRVCALERDLALLPNEDKTLIGDSSGLSGGQRARVNLARALYAEADVYLLDDPLSAVDASVAKHIFDKAIKEFLSEKIVILVTHQLQFVKSADKILLLQNGATTIYGNYTDILNKGFDFIKFVPEQDEPNEPTGEEVSTPSRTRRMMFKRTTSTISQKSASSIGSHRSRLESMLTRKNSSRIPDFMPSSPAALSVVNTYDDTESIMSPDEADFETSNEENMGDGDKAGGKAYLTYISASGGFFAILLIVLALLSSTALFSFSDWWLSAWTKTFDLNETRHDYIEESYFLSFDLNINALNFSLQTLILLILAIGRTTGFFYMCMKSSVKLHDRLFKCLVRAPIMFFESSPIGVLLNRCSRDMGIIDDILPATFFDALSLALMNIGIAVMICLLDYQVTISTVVLTVICILMYNLYVDTARNVKRIEGITRSPVFSHFSTTLTGLSTVRAYRAQDRMMQQFDLHQDQHSAAWFLFLASSRWFGIILDWLCNVYFALIVVFMLAKMDENNGTEIGLAITSAINLTNGFQWGVRQATEVETQMTSVERVDEFAHIPSEGQLEAPDHAKPDKEWPQYGAIDFCNVSLEYNPDDGPVLKDLTMSIKPGEKVGIVGRTGAGKSSLISTLFRLIDPTGEIVIDGIDICGIGLHDLRKKLSIIPQTPVLFSGTIRKNLDPFGEISDGRLWRALDEVQLREAVQELPGGLEAMISSEGSSFSVGQRQLICLARAILRRNRILILDEATANVDPKTDSLIQATIRKAFADCTILTIAHRLDTIIDCDRVLVLDAGQLAEFDEPITLLKDETSIFLSMVKATGKDTTTKLKLMAQKAHDVRVERS
ncbi:ATP-binding cassette sub-family C member 4 [Halotydeus destructor]|nr:ATP-binding cassette sub-family C member 4 [Halotydeus destructor]